MSVVEVLLSDILVGADFGELFVFDMVSDVGDCCDDEGVDSDEVTEVEDDESDVEDDVMSDNESDEKVGVN